MLICQGAEEKRYRDTGAYSLYVRMVFRYDGAEGGAWPFLFQVPVFALQFIFYCTCAASDCR
jgi:hypothetical protein